MMMVLAAAYPPMSSKLGLQGIVWLRMSCGTLYGGGDDGGSSNEI